MNITVAQLIASGVAPTQARQFAAPLSTACTLHKIDTPTRVSAFLGQLIHESARLTRLEESLYYTTPDRLMAVWPNRFTNSLLAIPYLRNPQKLANFVYTNRMGNGDYDTGDGWAYRGRGLIQLTGRANYTRAQVDCNRPYVSRPELVSQPDDAALTAAWFWSTNDFNPLADAWNIEAVTRKINGGTHGLADRRQFSEEALKALS